MRIIHHNERFVLVSQVANFLERCDIAVHRKHAVCRDDAQALPCCRLQLLLQVDHIHVFEDVPLGFREAHRVDNGCMIQLVAYDDILRAKECLKESYIRHKT